MAQTYAGSWALRSIIEDAQILQATMAQNFLLRRNQVRLMGAIQETSENCLPRSVLDGIENRRNSAQQVQINLFDKKAQGTKTSRQRSGSGQSGVLTLTPSFFDLVLEEFDMSHVNESLAQFMGEKTSTPEERDLKIREKYVQEFSNETMECYRNMYQRVEEQIAAFFEANKWALNTTADQGTLYTSYVADAKQIPAADAQLGASAWLQKVQTEATQNNFNQFGLPTLYHSTITEVLVKDYLAQGADNSFNFVQFINDFGYVGSNKFTDNVPTVKGTFYVTAFGALALYNYVYSFAGNPAADANGDVTRGEDTWVKPYAIGAGTTIMPDMPRMNIEMKVQHGYQDTSATYTNNDEAKIDIVQGVNLATTFGMVKAPASSGNPNESPIIKYEVLSS